MIRKNQYRYILHDKFGQIEAFPLGESGLEIIWEEPDDKHLNYAVKIDGKLQFAQQDFNRLYQSENGPEKCNPIFIQIQRKSGNAYMDVCTAIINLGNGEWDLDRCIVDLPLEKPNSDDFIKSSEDVNLFEFISITDRVTVNTVPFGETTNEDEDYFLEEKGPYIEPVSQPELQGMVLTKKLTKTEVGSPEWNSWANMMQCVDNIGNGYYPHTTYEYTYKRQVKWVAPGTTVTDPNVNTGETRSDGYFKIARVPGIVSPTPTVREWSPYYCSHYKEEVWTPTDDGSTGGQPSEELNLNIDNGLFLRTILVNLLSPYGIAPKSDFFNIRPSSPENAITNYVTGRKSTTANIVFFQKSDVKRYNDSENATVFKLSLKNLLNWLCETFNVRYDIVGSDLVIEHVSRIGQRNSTDITSAAFKKYLTGLRKYKYTSNDSPGKETFSFMDVRPDFLGPNDFNGFPIIYNSKCIIDKAKEVRHNVEKISTDIKYIIENNDKEKIDDDGFVMASCNLDDEGVLHIMRSHAILSAERDINNVFGWAHLHHDFWRHKRYLKSGKMNGLDTIFASAVNSKVGEKISIPFCNIETFDPTSIVKSYLGEGDIKSARYNLSHKTIDLEISYEDLYQNPDPDNGSGGIIYARLRQVQTSTEAIEGECNGNTEVVQWTSRNNIFIDFFSSIDASVPYNVVEDDHIEVRVRKTVTEGVVLGESNVTLSEIITIPVITGNSATVATNSVFSVMYRNCETEQYTYWSEEYKLEPSEKYILIS